MRSDLIIFNFNAGNAPPSTFPYLPCHKGYLNLWKNWWLNILLFLRCSKIKKNKTYMDFLLNNFKKSYAFFVFVFSLLLIFWILRQEDPVHRTLTSLGTELVYIPLCRLITIVPKEQTWQEPKLFIITYYIYIIIMTYIVYIDNSHLLLLTSLPSKRYLSKN